VLGSGVSSLSIWTAFDTITTAVSRVLKWVLKISWLRNKDESLTFATVGTSVVDGTDIIQGQATDLTKPDYFAYDDESGYAMRLEYERIIEEPLGGLALAQADVVLDNANMRFTPGYSPTIGMAIEPNRPMQMFLGFEVQGQDKTIPVFKGLTWRPQEDKNNRTVTIHAFDYIQFMNTYQLEKAIYTDQRSDQIIEDVLTTVGYTSSQYVLDEGLNTIGFAWFDKGETAGERIRKICEAEDAHFYQDENGVLRFENRRHYTQAPHGTTQWTINKDDILQWEEDKNVDIVNRCTVIAKPRAVQDTTEIWKDGIVEELERGEQLIIWAKWEDPVTSITDPAATTDYVANTASDGSGTDTTSDITVSVDKFTKTAKLTIQNNAGMKIYLTKLRLRGTPATVTSEIIHIYQDDDSIDKYERRELVIENDFIDSDEFARYLATAIVTKYKDPLKRVRVLVRGIPQIQLKDKVSCYDPDTATYSDYRVTKIQGVLSPGEMIQWLTLREISSYEADSWALVGTATVDNDNEFVGI